MEVSCVCSLFSMGLAGIWRLWECFVLNDVMVCYMLL
jgi:hypothetical protein